MLTYEEFNRLAGLLNNLYILSGVKFALMNEQGREVYTSSYRAPFCSMVMNEEAGARRCLNCDRAAVQEVAALRKPRRYLCHAGLYEVAMPVVDGGEVIATILFGQMLDNAPRDAQWARVEKQCAWHPDHEGLHQAFLHLRCISLSQMEACMEIVRACVSEVRLYSLSTADNRDDAITLRDYIQTHYAQPIDTDVLSRELHIGKTKLYALCRERFGMTPIRLVTQTRIDSARDLLLNSRESIKSIAQTVGFADANYFAKVFKKATGLSAKAYRHKGAVVK